MVVPRVPHDPAVEAAFVLVIPLCGAEGFDAFRRIDRVAEEVRVRALLIHAEDADAEAFYLRLAAFEPSPVDDLQLRLLMKDLRKAIRRS